MSLCIPCLVEVATAAGKSQHERFSIKCPAETFLKNEDSSVNPVSLQTCTS